MINLPEGDIFIDHKSIRIEGKVAHPPKGNSASPAAVSPATTNSSSEQSLADWQPFKATFSPFNLTSFYSCLGKMLKGGVEQEGTKPLWSTGGKSGRMSIFGASNAEVKKRFLGFLIVMSGERNERTRFALNDLTIRAMMHFTEIQALKGQQACIVPGREDSQLAIIRNSNSLSLVTPIHHLELDDYGKTLLLGSMEHMIETGELRPFKYKDIGCRNGGRNGSESKPVPMMSVRGELFRIEPDTALKIKLLCQ